MLHHLYGYMHQYINKTHKHIPTTELHWFTYTYSGVIINDGTLCHQKVCIQMPQCRQALIFFLMDENRGIWILDAMQVSM